MRKVLFIFDRVAHYHRELFRALEKQLAEHGIELHLLSGQAEGAAVGRFGVRDAVVQRESKYRFKEFRIGTYVFRSQEDVVGRIRELKPDVVVNMCHVGNWSHWRTIGLKRECGFRLVAWQCGYEYHPGRCKGWLLDRFVPRYDYHLAYHSNARDYALSHGARPDQITIMHNTINEERIVPVGKADAKVLVVRRHPQLDGRKVVLFVGAVLAEKRIELILHALDIMARRDVALLLVGDGEHLPKIRSLCVGRDDVVIAGAIVDGVGPYFDAADLYVLPGTGGLGINEAMAHRLPIVSGFADGSADDLVVDGENGYRLRDNSAQELAARMSEILDNPDLAIRMGEASGRMITGKFAFREFIGRIVLVLSRLSTL